MLEQAENALHQSVSLTTQLLTFSKGGKPIKKLISLLPVIENAAKFALSGSRSSCQFDIEPGLWQVNADEGQLGQVIQNIVLNAEQATPEGGTVVITAKNVLKPDSRHPQLTKGDYVEIAVHDSGIGIPEKYLQKIFDPYFTTKEKGSGLGLATSYSIIRNHDGLIDVMSELGKGSTFFIYLPAMRAEKKFKEHPAITSGIRKGKILVMDDDNLVRCLAGEQIKTLGHEVECAKDGMEAIEKFILAKDSGKPFDIVVLDLTVKSGIGGERTIGELRVIDPNVKAIVSSGYANSQAMANCSSYGFKARLTKPYSLEDLRDIINVLLSE
jgi:CheY-like chemotaxis protein